MVFEVVVGHTVVTVPAVLSAVAGRARLVPLYIKREASLKKLLPEA